LAKGGWIGIKFNINYDETEELSSWIVINV
jgi:hypothetical protein